MAVLAFDRLSRGTALLPLLQGEGWGEDGVKDAGRGEGGVDLLQDPRLFRAGRPLTRDRGATPSGFTALDDALPWGGFPRGALTELLLPAAGLGEIELIATAWAQLGARERLVFVAPPFVPYAPALRALWPLRRFIWIETNATQAPWAAEQCLRAGSVGAVALWYAGGDERVLRRLQLAAAEGDAHGFVFRPQRHAINSSPAALRLQIDATAGALRLRVLKCRGAVAPAQAMQRLRPFTRHPRPSTSSGQAGLRPSGDPVTFSFAVPGTGFPLSRE